MSHHSSIKTDNIDQIRTFYLNKQVKHIKQLTKNDCGTACFKMILENSPESVKIEKFKNLDKKIKDLNISSKRSRLNNSKEVNIRLSLVLYSSLKAPEWMHLFVSLWTIDIAHLCALENIKHLMYTITLGVQESYSSMDFYSKETNFNSETLRIEQKFSNAKELGINVIKDSINLEKIKLELNKSNLCITLIDANLLKGKNIQVNRDDLDSNEIYSSEDIKSISMVPSPTCCFYPFNNKNDDKNIKSKEDFDKLVESNIIKTNRSDYCGHFITLIGYDEAKQLIFYLNPSSDCNFSFTSFLNFEIARKSFGTDQDILFVYQN